MVAGIFFLKEMLLYVFTRILLGVRSRLLLSLLFSATAAVAVRVSGRADRYGSDHLGGDRLLPHLPLRLCRPQGGEVAERLTDDSQVPDEKMAELRQFRPSCAA